MICKKKLTNYGQQIVRNFFFRSNDLKTRKVWTNIIDLCTRTQNTLNDYLLFISPTEHDVRVITTLMLHGVYIVCQRLFKQFDLQLFSLVSY